MIKREIYMSRIRPFIGNELIKVLTGIRRKMCIRDRLKTSISVISPINIVCEPKSSVLVAVTEMYAFVPVSYTHLSQQLLYPHVKSYHMLP